MPESDIERGANCPKMQDIFATWTARLAKSCVLPNNLDILIDFWMTFWNKSRTLWKSSWTVRGRHFLVNILPRGAKLAMSWKLPHCPYIYNFSCTVLASPPMRLCGSQLIICHASQLTVCWPTDHMLANRLVIESKPIS